MANTYILGTRAKRSAGAALFTVAVLVASVSGLVATNTKDRAQAAFPGANGKIAYVDGSTGAANIWTINPDGSGQQQVTFNDEPGVEGSNSPEWSPNGHTLVFAHQYSDPTAPAGYYIQAFTVESDGTNLQQVTTGPDTVNTPSFSPDGTQITYSRNSSEDFNSEDIYTINLDGTLESRLTATADNEFAPAWSPDGSRVAFIKSVPTGGIREFHSTIASVSPDGSGYQVITEFTSTQTVSSFDWSPDGSKIVYATTERQGPQRFRMYTADSFNPANSGLAPNTVQVADLDGSSPHWSPDGTRLVFVDLNLYPPGPNNYHIYTANPDGSDVVEVPVGNTNSVSPSWGIAASAPERACNDLQPTYLGTPAADIINGTPEADVIMGLGGNDTINGLGGNDTICGNAGDDTINGGAGSDYISGGNGTDTLDGAGDNDTINGNAGTDTINGGNGEDTLSGAGDNDQVNGGGGNDVIEGNLGDDILNGNGENDILRGGQGVDTLSGGTGDDQLFGNRGNDNLNGNAGTNTNTGGADTDTCRNGTAVRCEL